MSGRHQLAQVNIGRAKGETTDPVMAEFMAALPAINAIADNTFDFVWRLETEDGDATAVRPYGDDLRIISRAMAPLRMRSRSSRRSTRKGGRSAAIE